MINGDNLLTSYLKFRILWGGQSWINHASLTNRKRIPPLMAVIRQKDGRRTESVRTYEIKELRVRHFEIIRRALLGQSYTEIARALGVTPQNVSDVLNSELAREQLAVLQAARNAESVDLSHEIAEVAPAALRILRETVSRANTIIESDPTYIPPELILKTSRDVLDRAGYGAVKREVRDHRHMHFTLQEVEAMRERALAKAQDDLRHARNVVRDEVEDGEYDEIEDLDEVEKKTLSTVGSEVSL